MEKEMRKFLESSDKITMDANDQMIMGVIMNGEMVYRMEKEKGVDLTGILLKAYRAGKLAGCIQSAIEERGRNDNTITDTVDIDKIIEIVEANKGKDGTFDDGKAYLRLFDYLKKPLNTAFKDGYVKAMGENL